MQDQQNQNRGQGQDQQNMQKNWQQGDQTMGSDDSGNMNRSDTEVNTPQQPRHSEEPFTGGGQSWGTNDSPTSGAGNQMNRDQSGGSSSMIGDRGSMEGDRMGSDMGNRSGSAGMGGQSNQGEGMRGGSMSDQGNMSDQRGGKMSGQQGEQSGTDDYQRNEIGSSTTGSTGSNRSSDM